MWASPAKMGVLFVFRRSFAIALAIVILSRAIHCLYVDVDLCARVAAAASQTPPLADPQDSDPDESGCLCKGAVIIAPCLPADLPEQGKFSPQIFGAPASLVAAVAVDSRLSDQSLPPPCTARQLRALIASWQI